MKLLLFLLITILFAVIINGVRHFLPKFLNIFTINLSIIAIIFIPAYYLSISPWVVLFLYTAFILSMTFYYKLVGAFIAIAFAILLAFLQRFELAVLIEIAVIYIGLVGLFLLIHRRIQNQRKQKEKLISQLMKQSKQLHIIREIGTMMQQTFSLDKQLMTILTAITAGHGLGFNRAIIFLKEGNVLIGRMAVGPLSAEQGFHIWENIVTQKYELSDLIEIKKEDVHSDLELNDIVQSLTIPLSFVNTVVSEALNSRNPVIIREYDEYDSFQKQMKELFQMEEFAIVPLSHKGKEIGIIVIDNIVNKKPILLEDIEGVVPFAYKAAIGIEQAKVYESLEQLAKRDGLTGLYNQRSLQQSLDLLFQKNMENWPVSLTMIDIDSFKHYNDRNGHLLGNEVLIDLANLLQASVGKGHSIYRFGGEELSIVMPNTTVEEAYELAEEIRLKVFNYDFREGVHQPNGALTISIGVASTEKIKLLTKEALISAADEALYKAKNSGKNKTIVYEGGK